MKHVREAKRILEREGAVQIVISKTRRHVRIDCLLCGRAAVFFVSTSPSDGRWSKNFQGDIRRMKRRVVS